MNTEPAAAASAPAGAESSLAEELRRSIGSVVRAVRGADTMPPGEAAALGFLDRGGPLTTAELAQRRGVTHQAAAKAVHELTAAGYVRAEPHPSDGRKQLLHLTEAGRARLLQERAHRAGVLDAALQEAFSEAERQRLGECVALLDRLAERLNAR